MDVQSELPQMTERTLYGRRAELGRIQRFIDEVGVRGATRLVIGEAGVGKSALMAAAASKAAAAGLRVLKAVGSEFEVDVSYAGLNQLLLPAYADLLTLPAALRDALVVALGLGTGVPAEPLVVANAALALVRRIAQTAPVLVLVDDVQWIDRASAVVLGFIARRIDEDRIGVAAMLRQGRECFLDRRGFDEIELQPLDEAGAAEMVDAYFPELSGRVRQRVLELAQGNPLAIMELPACLAETDARRLEPRIDVVPLSERLELAFASRVEELPPQTRRLLLAATFEGTGDIRVLRSVAGDERGLAALAPAERAGLIRVEDGNAKSSVRVVFEHPLVKSAVVGLSTHEERREARLALAEALRHDPERRAWHWAESATGPNEEVAALLERAARRAMRRGDAYAAMAALIKAAELSPERGPRARRLTEAAYIGVETSGSAEQATALLADARSADPDSPDSLRAATAAVFLLMNGDGDITSAHRLLVGAIESGEHGYDAANSDLIDAMHLLLLVCWYTGRVEAWEPFVRAFDAIKPTAPDMLTLTWLTFADPVRTAASSLELAERVLGCVSDADPGNVIRIGTASVYLDRLGDLREPSWRLVVQGRAEGPNRRHVGALMHLCLDDYLVGRWDECEELAEEGLEICKQDGLRFFTWYFWHNRGIMAAGRGRFDEAYALADEITHWALPRGVLGAAHFAHHPRMLAAAGQGDYEAAFRHAAAASRPGTLAPYIPHATWLMFDLVEAALHIGRHADACAHVAAMKAADLAAISPRMALLQLGAEALVSDDPAVHDRLCAKLTAPESSRWVYDATRIRLALGEKLRRERDATAAKLLLEDARRAFEGMGAEPWVARAATELRACGIRNGQHFAPMKLGELTQQELSIAQLAAEGLTNRQIGERLFLSHRTVGAHLYRIFPKLGITTRASLRDALTELAQSED